MKHFTLLAIAASALCTDALNLARRTDGQPPKVVRHDIHRKHIADPMQRLAIDRKRMQKRMLKRDGTQTVSLSNEETLYFMEVQMGTPQQTLALHLDTGSSDLWVNVADSQLCESRGSPCQSAGTYNANSSSSYQYVNSDFKITYVDGSGSTGDYATDTVIFGNGVTLNKQQFGIGYSSSSEEGIIGIGYMSNEVAASTGSPYPNVPQNLMINDYIGCNAYSLWLNDLDASSGSILFGGVNSAKYTGSLETLPIVKENGIYAEFLIGLTSIGTNGSNNNIADGLNVAALLDSGSSLMYLPDEAAETIYNQVGAKYEETQGAAIVNCKLAQSSQTIDFTFSSPTIKVSMSELVIPADSRDTVCILGIGKAGDSTPVLGDTFLRSAYVVYDMTHNEISIAQTNFNSAKDDIQEITNSTHVPAAVTVTNPVSVTVGTPGARNNDEPTVSSPGMAPPTAAVNLAALGLAGAGLLFAL